MIQQNIIVSSIQTDDKDTFAEIYRLFFKKIYRFVYFSVRNKDLAEDIAQETFLKAWKAFTTFSPKKGTVQSFLYTIARNLVIDWQRKKKPVSIDLFYETIQDGKNIEEDFARKQNQEVIHYVMGSLSDLEKHIVIMRYFEEMTFFQIAQVIGEKEGAIRVKLHRTLKKMKQYIENKNLV